MTTMGFTFGPDDDTPVFVISVAAELAGMHAQTLRQYDRLGLVNPSRTPGGGRRYSARDVALLREVQRLSQEEGVNLAGIKRIIELENQVDALRAHVAELSQELPEPADLVPPADFRSWVQEATDHAEQARAYRAEHWSKDPATKESVNIVSVLQSCKEIVSQLRRGE